MLVETKEINVSILLDWMFMGVGVPTTVNTATQNPY